MLKKLVFYNRTLKIIRDYFYEREKRSLQSKTINWRKKNIIANLIEEYDIKTTEDIQEALKVLLGGTIKSMLEAEMDEHAGYRKYQHSDGNNYRNGTKWNLV